MEKLTISISPHVFSPVDTRCMMKGVFKALLPAAAASIYFFRWQAVLIIITTIGACIFTEYLMQKLRKRPIQLEDGSAILTGLLLALVLPPDTPLWMAFLGGAFAIIFGKEIFGGLGHNIFNPALLSRAFLMAAFPVTLTTWSNPVTVDTLTTATPLGISKFEHIVAPYMSLFSGNTGGSLGETSALALLIGAAYLFYNKIIDYRIPVGFIGTVAVFAGITHVISPGLFSPPLFHVLAGGLLLGAVYMATDPVSSPVTAKGRWIFGIGCGLLAMTIRLWGGLPEGVMYSILLMNAVTPLINKFSMPNRYGVKVGK